MESAGDVDYFRLSLGSGVTYRFTIVAATGSTQPSYLDQSLVNAANVRVGPATSGAITFKPTADGTYYLAVSNSSAGVGSYVITASNTVSVPVYRFFDSRTGTQFLTSNASERDTVLATRPDLVNEGVGLSAAAANDPAASPVYRFFDTNFGTHFFTSSTGERDTIQATRADLIYEGVGFNEYLTQQANTAAVYRFFDSNRGTHFFTSSAGEVATIRSTRPDLVAEGISFYAPTT